MTTDNIFGNDILNGDLTTSLVPELGQENILIDVTPSETSLIDPLTQELSLTEPEIAIDEIDTNNHHNASSFDNIPVANIDLLTAANPEEFQVSDVSASNAFFTSPTNELQFQGGFGDYDEGNDITFEVKNDDEVVVETYSLTGKGQASLYRDDEDGKAYIFFSGTDETTSVEISAKSNIQFDSYIGDSLKIETTGSIDAGSVTLSNPDETGLVLKSGIQAGEETLEVLGYDAIHLGEGTAKGINNEGEVVVDGYSASLSFIYSDGEINYLGSDNSITSNGINDSGQVVGSFVNSDNNTHAFVSSGGAISDLGVLPEAETYEIYNGSDFEEVPYNFARSYGKAINNNGQVVGTASSKYSVGYDESRSRAFISDGGSMTDLQNDLNDLFGYEVDLDENPDAYWFFASEAYGINDSGQIIGSHFNYDGQQKAFVYGGGQNINLHSLLGDDVRSSVARLINNEGQIIGTFTTKRSGSTFIYNDGEIKTFGGSLFDLNNNGIALGLSGGTPILYDINNDTSINLNLNSNIDSEEAIWLSSAQAINDEGQIAATGYFVSDVERANNAFLLNPRFAEPELDDYINIGNISTFGDSVLLQGNEINLAGQAITTQGGEITFDGATTVESNLIIDSSVTEDEVITGGGDITFTNTLDAASAGNGNLRFKAGTGNILFGDTVGAEAALKKINIIDADTVTANADITSDKLIKINATEDIVTQNLTSENGNVKLISEEKSITAKDIISGSETEKGNIVLQGFEGVRTDNLNAYELGIVKIKSGEVVEADTEGADDTIAIGSTITGSITGKKLEAASTGGFAAIGDIVAHDGKIRITTHDNILTKKIESVTKSIDLVSTNGAVTVDGELISGKGGVGIVAQDDITTQKINSAAGVVGLSSFDGSVIVEDDITTVKGGVVIAGKAGVEVKNITTQVGEVNIGSSGDIDVNGRIATDFGYINLKTNGSISAQSAITDKGFVEIAAGGVASANIATGIGTSTLVSVANLDDEILLAGGSGGSLSATVTRPQDLSDEEAEIFTEFLQSVIYRARPLGEFVAGALYEWALSNGDEIRGLMPGFLKLDEREEARLNARLNQSQAFELGRLLGEGAAVAQGIYEFVAGSAAVGGGSGLCVTGIGCFAGAPAIATGVVLQAHGSTLAVNSASEFGDKLRDILSPNRMASSGGADDVIGLSRETGISQGSINNVYDDLNPSDIKLVGDKLSNNNVENLFDKADQGGLGSELVQNVTKIVKIFADDVDAVADVQENLSLNKVNRNNKQFLDDSQLQEAFRETTKFIDKYKGKVSGAFANRFGRAAAKGNDLGLPNPQPRDFKQAAGEIETAEDLLDGKTIVGNIDELYGIPDRNTAQGLKNPEYTITKDGLTRLAEVKIPDGNIASGKNTFNNSIKRNINSAVEQIIGRSAIDNPANKAYVRLDYRKSPDSATQTRDWVFRKVRDRLNVPVEVNGINAKGTDVVELVEVFYKDAGGVQKLEIKVENGIAKLLN